MMRIGYSLLFLIFYISAPAQMSYIFNRISHSDGLNTNKVNCVWQDKKGFLWVGTENGIQRFDGRKFISFRAGGLNHSMPPFGVDQILDAGDGKMWLRQGNLIGLFDPVSFHYFSVPVQPHKPISPRSDLKMFCDSKGNTFLCVGKYGLLWYDPVENKFTEGNLPILIPEGWPVNHLFEDTVTGDYWICSDNGLAVYQSKNHTLSFSKNNLQRLPFFEDNNLTFVNNFFIDKNRTWWIFYWDFNPHGEKAVVVHYDPGKHQVIGDTTGLRAAFNGYAELSWIFETQKGQIWIGGVNALLSYEPDLKRLIQNKRPNPRDFDIKCRVIKQIYEDRENNIWFCTDNGLYLATPEKSVLNLVFDNQNQGGDITVTSILETKGGENWIGTWGNGILVFDEQFREVKHYMYKSMNDKNSQNFKLVWDLCEHSESGFIWSGCQNGALAVFNPESKKEIGLLEPPVFEKATIRQIIEDKNGSLIFGTQRGRLVRWANGTEINDKNFEIIRDFNTTIYLLFKDNADRIWVGTHNTGVFVMDPTGKNVLFQFNEKPFVGATIMGNSVFDIEQYNDSIFFLSTGFLNIVNINSGKIRTLTLFDGLPGANVTQLLKDDEDILWFTNNNGLGSYNYKKNIFVSYNERNGIIMAERSVNAKFKMQNGEFWFGGENSLFGFRPEGLKFGTAPPDVTLTDFKLFNTYIPMDSLLAREKIQLNPDQNSFTFYFSSLSYTQQDKLLYYYKLDGVDKYWIKAEQDLAANYTTLAPGRYTFNVKCVNMQGNESVNVTKLSIIILPPFYRTWWFIILLILLVTWLVYSVYRMRINKLLAVERIRNKVARDLHDDVGSTLSTINILSSMAKTKLLTDPVKTSEYITKITDNSQYMMEAMDDIVWSIKPDNDSMQKIIARMREYASTILEPKDIEISFQVGENIHDLKLNMETRRDVFLIYKEAANNIAKYAHCTKVGIQLTHENKRFVMNIRDNGAGFNVRLADSGNGLGNMQKRAEALRGTININSREGAGTEISLNIPVDF